MMLREVQIENVEGRLFLTSMPGRNTEFDAARLEIQTKAIAYLVSLTSLDEIRDKSPDFAEAIEQEELDFKRLEFPIPDLGVPADREAYLHLVRKIAQDIRDSKHVAIHCAGGIGRTGTLAASVLVALGQPVRDALQRVESAGSHPETYVQNNLVDWVAEQLSQQ